MALPPPVPTESCSSMHSIRYATKFPPKRSMMSVLDISPSAGILHPSRPPFNFIDGLIVVYYVHAGGRTKPDWAAYKQAASQVGREASSSHCHRLRPLVIVTVCDIGSSSALTGAVRLLDQHWIEVGGLVHW